MSMQLTRVKRGRTENPIVYLDVKIGDRAAGRLLIELRADVVPQTAENFRRLCTGETRHPVTGKRRQFAQCPFHRVVKGKFCQSGDYTHLDGSGGESTFDETSDNQETKAGVAFADENFILRHTGPGILSMVNTGPDSNSSQFYLHFAANPQLDDQHVVFGCLLGPESFAVLDAIHAVATERGDAKKPVKISACGQIDCMVTNS